MDNEYFKAFLLVAFLASAWWLIYCKETQAQAEESEKRKILAALKAKSDAHKVLVPIFMEQRHHLNKSLADSLQEMKNIAKALQLLGSYREVSEDVLKHQKVID